MNNIKIPIAVGIFNGHFVIYGGEEEDCHRELAKVPLSELFTIDDYDPEDGVWYKTCYATLEYQIPKFIGVKSEL